MCDLNYKPLSALLSELVEKVDDSPCFNTKGYNYSQSIAGLAKINQLEANRHEIKKLR